MPVLDRIAYFQNRHDEVPNQELARELVAARDVSGVREIAENLWSKNVNVQADCVKVLYEIGYLDPSLIAGYVGDFVKLLRSRNNRLVWGGMITLSTVAGISADEIFLHLEEVKKAMASGSVITVDNGVKTLALVASQKDEYRKVIFPDLLYHLATCRPKDVPQHSEKTLPAVNSGSKGEFLAVLEKRMIDLSGTQVTRLKKVMREAEKR